MKIKDIRLDESNSIINGDLDGVKILSVAVSPNIFKEIIESKERFTLYAKVQVFEHSRFIDVFVKYLNCGVCYSQRTINNIDNYRLGFGDKYYSIELSYKDKIFLDRTTKIELLNDI